MLQLHLLTNRKVEAVRIWLSNPCEDQLAKVLVFRASQPDASNCSSEIRVSFEHHITSGKDKQSTLATPRLFFP